MPRNKDRVTVAKLAEDIGWSPEAVAEGLGYFTPLEQQLIERIKQTTTPKVLWTYYGKMQYCRRIQCLLLERLTIYGGLDDCIEVIKGAEEHRFHDIAAGARKDLEVEVKELLPAFTTEEGVLSLYTELQGKLPGDFWPGFNALFIKRILELRGNSFSF